MKLAKNNEKCLTITETQLEGDTNKLNSVIVFGDHVKELADALKHELGQFKIGE